MKIILPLTFILFQLVAVANLAAHSNLENLSKVEIIKIQKDLVSRGYLNEKQFEYGVANFETDEAYDKLQVILRIEQNEGNASNTIATKTVNLETDKKKLSFWAWAFKNLLDFLGL